MAAKCSAAHLYHQILLGSLWERSSHCKFGILAPAPESEISRQHQTQNVTSTPQQAWEAICCSWYPGGFCFFHKITEPSKSSRQSSLWLEGKGWKGWDGKDKHHPEVFATSLSFSSLLHRSFIFCCSCEVETQITAGVNKQIPSYSIINKVVPVSSRASSEICLNVFSPKPGAQRFHFPILWVKSWNYAQETQCQTFIRKLKNLDFLQIRLCWYKGNHCNAESLTAGNCCVTEKIFKIYFHPSQGVL